MDNNLGSRSRGAVGIQSLAREVTSLSRRLPVHILREGGVEKVRDTERASEREREGAKEREKRGSERER